MTSRFTDMALVEEAILARLADLTQPQGGPLRTLRGHGAAWPLARTLSALAGPAALLRYAGWRPPTPGAGQAGGWARWILTVAVGGGLDEAARRRGAAGAPERGAWEIARRARERLAGWPPFEGAGPLIPRGEEPLAGAVECAALELAWEHSLPGTGFSRPLLAAGISASAAAGAVEADQVEFELGAGQGAAFAPGAPALLCDAASGAQNRSLGRILAIEGDSLRVERAAGRAYGAAALWSPARWWRWSTGRFPPLAESLEPGIEYQRFLDGTGAAARVAAARRVLDFGIGPIPRGEIAEFRAWLDAAARGGLDPFTWVDEAGDTAAAWFGAAAWREEETVEGLAALRFDLHLGEKGGRAA